MALDAEEYETHDIYLAAYFDTAGCKFLRKRKQGARVFFIFTNPAGSMSEMRTAYFSGQAKVIASQYAQKVKDYKELCHE